MKRCPSVYPALPTIRCELRLHHQEQHGHSFYARYWDDPEDTLLGVAPHVPGTDYYDGRDGSLEVDTPMALDAEPWEGEDGGIAGPWPEDEQEDTGAEG